VEHRVGPFIWFGLATAGAGVLLVMCVSPPDACTPLATRCAGNVAEICDAKQRWAPFLDCDDVGVQNGGGLWTCCVSEDGDAGPLHTCLPGAQCSGGGAG
jgi:hypothetical protein